MTRWLAIGLLSAVAAAGEDWAAIEREWHAALDKYEAAARRSRAAKHPFPAFADRFRRFVQDHGNAPAALPAVVELVKHTPDRNELARLVVHLRETYPREEEVGEAIPAIVRMGGPQAERTLRDLAGTSPHDAVKSRARRGLRELTSLQVGQTAPPTIGTDAEGGGLAIEDHRGKVVVLLFGDGGRKREVAELRQRLAKQPFAVLGAGAGDAPWPQWTETMRVAGAWNALDGPRLFVLDHEGVIRGKDLAGKELKDLLRELLKAARAG